MDTQTINAIIEGMNEESKIFWLSAMVKQNLISASQAGYIIYNNK
jgi:hypothetical protein